MAAKKLRKNWDAFSVIADPIRREILDLLKKKGPIRATDLAKEIPEISRPAVSKHLRILREYDFAKEEWIGRECYYSLNSAPLRKVKLWLQDYELFWSAKLERLKQLSEN